MKNHLGAVVGVSMIAVASVLLGQFAGIESIEALLRRSTQEEVLLCIDGFEKRGIEEVLAFGINKAACEKEAMNKLQSACDQMAKDKPPLCDDAKCKAIPPAKSSVKDMFPGMVDGPITGVMGYFCSYTGTCWITITCVDPADIS